MQKETTTKQLEEDGKCSSLILNLIRRVDLLEARNAELESKILVLSDKLSSVKMPSKEEKKIDKRKKFESFQRKRNLQAKENNQMTRNEAFRKNLCQD